LPKKIQIQLLLADLALQFGNLLARRVHVPWRLLPSRRKRHGLAWPSPAPQGVSTSAAKSRVPKIQIFPQHPQHPQLTRERDHALSRHHPANRRQLERTAENTRFLSGHQSSPGELSLFIVSHFWGALQPKGVSEFRNQEQSYTTLAENEEWLAINIDKTIPFAKVQERYSLSHEQAN
jgi:hypothetical protein